MAVTSLVKEASQNVVSVVMGMVVSVSERGPEAWEKIALPERLTTVKTAPGTSWDGSDVALSRSLVASAMAVWDTDAILKAYCYS